MAKKWQFIVVTVVFAMAGIWLGLFVGKLLKPMARGATLVDGSMVAVVLPMFWLAIVWHELGHVIGGQMAGFRLQLFTAGPLRLDRVGDQLRVSFNRSPGLWGGVASSVPAARDAGERLRERMLLAVAGGPAASLAGGVLFLPAMLLWPESPRLAAACFTFAAFSVLVGIATLLPIANAGFVNDGLRILQLREGHEAAMRWVANVAMSGLARELRPRDWPRELAEMPAVGESFDGVLAMWLRSLWHLDREEFAAAKHWLELALGSIAALPQPVHPAIHATAADFYARIAGDAERGRKHLDEASRAGMVSPEALVMAEAAVLAAEGKGPLAMAAVERGRAMLGELSGTSREAAVEILDAIAAAARGSSASPDTGRLPG